MRGYRKPSGAYIELSDGTPVASSLQPVALRPTAHHTWGTTWDSDPMNPMVCWRMPTTAETNAMHDTALQDFLDSVGGKVVKALVLVGVEKGQWTLTELRAKYRTL